MCNKFLIKFNKPKKQTQNFNCYFIVVHILDAGWVRTVLVNGNLERENVHLKYSILLGVTLSYSSCVSFQISYA